MSRRSVAGSIGRWYDRLASDSERLAARIVAVGTVLVAGVALFGGFLPAGGFLVGLLYPLAVLFPLLGFVIVVGALWWTWRSPSSIASPFPEGVPPEANAGSADHRVAREANALLDDAASEWYWCRGEGAAAEVSRRLVDGAVRRLTARRGLEVAAARETVEDGTWTDDPVAAAFLGNGVDQPLGERLRAAVDPGAAHDRRVRRALDAIESIGDSERTASSTSADRTQIESSTSADRHRTESARSAPEVDR